MGQWVMWGQWSWPGFNPDVDATSLGAGGVHMNVLHSKIL